VKAIIVFATLMIACATLRADETPLQVLFVCEHGSVKSVMAATYFNQLATERGLPFRAISRGSAPGSDTVSARDVATSEQIVAISTELPRSVEAPAAKVEHWNDVPAASANYAAARASLKAHVEQLLLVLAQSHADD
jgi:arsenate reductase